MSYYYKEGFIMCNLYGGTFKGELHRTADLLIDIAEEKGVFYVVAFLYDVGYTREDIKELLPILQNKKGSIKKNK